MVDSGLVRMTRRPRRATPATRAEVFAVVDAAFAQRRKTLRAALAGWAGGPAAADRLRRAGGHTPHARGEALPVEQFGAIAAAALDSGYGGKLGESGRRHEEGD